MQHEPKKPLSHRPKKSGTDIRQKQNVATFRVTAEERAEIEAAALAAGLTAGSYIRQSVLKVARTGKRRRPLADAAALPRLLGELNRIGGNINQITRRVNFGETPLGYEFRQALAGHVEIIAAIRAVLGLAGK
jgi:methyl coenzyme M reductase beta subunit